MPESLGTFIGQFSSSGGKVQPRAANVRAVEPADDLPGAERGSLYMLVEVSGGGHAALYRQMLSAAQSAFYEASGTVSAALMRAVRSAHTALVRANEALPEANWRAGISLAALQGQELTIAQSGPALALVSHPKTVEQFPSETTSWGQPLGGPERPKIDLFRTTVEAGSMLLLAQSTWLDSVNPRALAAAAAAESLTLATDYLGQLAGTSELSALLVGIEGATGQAAAPAATNGTAKTAVVAGATARAVSSSAPAAPAPARVPAESPAYEEAVFDDEFEEEPRGRSPWPLLLALVIIPAIIGALVLGMWWMYRQRVEKQFTQTLDGATLALNEVEAAPDEATAGQRLTAANDFLLKARLLRPNDPRLKEQETRYQEHANRIYHVIPLYGMVPLWEFKEEERDLARVLVNGDSVYVLDKGKNAVYRFILSQLGDTVEPADPADVISKTQQVDTMIVSDLVDLTWMDATNGQRSKLLVLDTANNLIGYDVTYKAGTVPVAGRTQWGTPQLITGYNAKLYVADTKAGQVWRHQPTANGYETAAEPYFANGATVDLSGIQGISIDGNVWLLFADGRLLKYLAGEQQSFELKGLPNPISTPVAVTAALDSDRLYVADAGNGRIVEFNKNGEFQRQFSPREGEALRDMRSLFLDEAANAFYILTSDKLYKAAVPAPGASEESAPAQ